MGNQEGRFGDADVSFALTLPFHFLYLCINSCGGQ